MRKLLALSLIIVFALVGCKAGVVTSVKPTVAPVESTNPTSVTNPNQTISPTLLITPEPTVLESTEKPNNNVEATKKPSVKATIKPTKKPVATKRPIVKVTPKSTTKPSGKSLFINEVCGSNGLIIKDEFGKFEDWIEIYNASNSSINLNGYYITDSEKTLNKFQLSNVSIGPKQHIIVWASGKAFTQTNGQVHTNFKIAIEGEPILLVAPDGIRVVDKFEKQAFERDKSIGRSPSGNSKWVTFNTPTPGNPN